MDISLDSIKHFIIRNPEMPPKSLGDKFCRLDISMTVNGQRVDLAERLYTKARHDETQALFNERRKIAKNLLTIDLPINQIAKLQD